MCLLNSDHTAPHLLAKRSSPTWWLHSPVSGPCLYHFWILHPHASVRDCMLRHLALLNGRLKPKLAKQAYCHDHASLCLYQFCVSFLISLWPPHNPCRSHIKIAPTPPPQVKDMPINTPIPPPLPPSPDHDFRTGGGEFMTGGGEFMDEEDDAPFVDGRRGSPFNPRYRAPPLVTPSGPPSGPSRPPG
jgi:hypothetical protein